MDLINKAKNLIYFLIVGWGFWIAKQLKDGRKAKQELFVDNYELKKKDMESGIEKENIDKLVDDTNRLYKPGGGNN